MLYQKSELLYNKAAVTIFLRGLRANPTVLEPSRVLSVIHSFDCHSGEVASVGDNNVH